MIRFFIFCICLTFGSGLKAQHKHEGDSLRKIDVSPQFSSYIGKEYPKFSLITTDLQTITTESVRGKVVFINFWFSTCSPCVAEFPALNEMYGRFKDRADFQFVSVSIDSVASISETKQRWNIEYPVVSLRDLKQLAVLKQRQGFPTSVVLDQAGKIVFWHSGGSPYAEEASQFVRNAYSFEIERLLHK